MTSAILAPTAPSKPRARLWALVRPEEYLLVAVIGAFVALDALGITTLLIGTNFIKAGADAAGIFLLLSAGVAGWRAKRRALGRSDVLSGVVVALLTVVPLIFIALIGTRVIPWDGDALAVGIVLATAWVAGCAWQAARAPLAPGLWPFGRDVALDMIAFVRAWFPFIVLLACYENALWLVVRANPHLQDAAIFRLDQILFGGHLDIWFQHITSPALTEVMAFFYDSLYLYPIVIGMALFFARRMRAFRSFLLAFVLAGYVGYVGYLIIPVVGPVYYYPKIYTVELTTGEPPTGVVEHVDDDSQALSFYVLSQKLADKAAYGGNAPRNCFPSLHVGWAMVFLIFMWRHLRKLFYACVGPLIMLMLATSYLRYHYVTDIVGGILLAILTSAFAPWLVTRWERWAGRPPDADGTDPDPVTPPVFLGSSVRARFGRLWRPARYVLPVGFFFVVTGYVYLSAYGDSERAAREVTEEYTHREGPTLPPAEQLGTQFENAVELVGTRFEPADWEPGQLVTITSWWRCLRPLAGDWKIFVHVRGPDDGVLVNADHYPVFGKYGVARWVAEDFIEDVVVVRMPSSARGTRVAVWTGLYAERGDGRRAHITAPGKAPATSENAVKVTERALR